MITNLKLFLKKYWMFVVLALVSAFMVLTFLLFETVRQDRITPINIPGQPPSEPSPSFFNPSVPLNEQVPPPGSNYSATTPADEIASKQDEAVLNLINALPYKGTNIYLSYSFTNFQFTLQENELELEKSEKEFNELLVQYGIKNRSWLKNLVIQRIKGTQEETSTSPDYLFGR